MRRLVLLAVLVLFATSAIAVAAAVPDARLTVTEATPTTETVVTGEPTTIDVTVALDGASQTAVELDSVRIETTDGEELASADSLGSLSPGGSLTVPVTTTFEEPGERSLRVVAETTDEDGDTTTATRPLSVVVEQAPPLVDVESVETVAGTETTLALNVSNPTNEQLRNVVLSVSGTNLRAETDQRSIASLAPGETVERSLTVVPQVAGNATAQISVTYTTSSGATATFDRTVEYTAEPLVADLGLSAAVASSDEATSNDGVSVSPDGGIGGLDGLLGGQGGTNDDDTDESESMGGVRLTVTNFGNAPAEAIVVTPIVDGEELPRATVSGPIAPGESATTTVDLSRVPAGTVRFDVAYETGDRAQETALQYEHRPDAGDVTLTGANIQRSGDTLTLTGNLGNPAGGTVSGVVVTVNETEHVAPTYPQRDYFVGTLEPGEFAPFDLTATVDETNATTVPVEVTFRVDGEQRTEQFELPYDDAHARSQGADGGSTRGALPGMSTPLSVISALSVIGAVLIGAGAIVYRRRQ